MAEYLTSSSQKLDRSSGIDYLAENLWGGRYVKPKSPRWTQCGQSKRKKASATPLRKRYLWTSSTVEELTFLPVLYRHHLRSEREDALCLAPPQGGVAAIEHSFSGPKNPKWISCTWNKLSTSFQSWLLLMPMFPTSRTKQCCWQTAVGGWYQKLMRDQDLMVLRHATLVPMERTILNLCQLESRGPQIDSLPLLSKLKLEVTLLVKQQHILPVWNLAAQWRGLFGFLTETNCVIPLDRHIPRWAHIVTLNYQWLGIYQPQDWKRPS